MTDIFESAICTEHTFCFKLANLSIKHKASILKDQKCLKCAAKYIANKDDFLLYAKIKKGRISPFLHPKLIVRFLTKNEIIQYLITCDSPTLFREHCAGYALDRRCIIAALNKYAYLSIESFHEITRKPSMLLKVNARNLRFFYNMFHSKIHPVLIEKQMRVLLNYLKDDRLKYYKESCDVHKKILGKILNQNTASVKSECKVYCSIFSKYPIYVIEDFYKNLDLIIDEPDFEIALYIKHHYNPEYPLDIFTKIFQKITCNTSKNFIISVNPKFASMFDIVELTNDAFQYNARILMHWNWRDIHDDVLEYAISKHYKYISKNCPDVFSKVDIVKKVLAGKPKLLNYIWDRSSFQQEVTMYRQLGHLF